MVMMRASVLVGMIICTALAVSGIIMMNWSAPAPPDQTVAPIYPDTTGMGSIEAARAVDQWRVSADRYQTEQEVYAGELETFAIARSIGQWVLWPNLLALIWLSAILSIGRKNGTSP
jgi:hypothetical protein